MWHGAYISIPSLTITNTTVQRGSLTYLQQQQKIVFILKLIKPYLLKSKKLTTFIRQCKSRYTVFYQES